MPWNGSSRRAWNTAISVGGRTGTATAMCARPSSARASRSRSSTAAPPSALGNRSRSWNWTTSHDSGRSSCRSSETSQRQGTNSEGRFEDRMVGATADASAKVASTSVFQLAWPVMVANLLQTLTTTVDVIMVGSLGSEAPAAVAAVGFGAQFIFLFFSVMISVSAGTIALVARAVGANDPGEADHILKQSLVLGAIHLVRRGGGRSSLDPPAAKASAETRPVRRMGPSRRGGADLQKRLACGARAVPPAGRVPRLGRHGRRLRDGDPRGPPDRTT